MTGRLATITVDAAPRVVDLARLTRGQQLLAAARGDGTQRHRVLFGASINSGTTLADFQTFAAQIAPARIHLPMFFQSLNGAQPLWYSGYPTTYLNALQADAMYVTISPPSGPLKAVLTGGMDSWIATEAARAVAYGKPVLLRIAHEFNGGPWNPYGFGQETAAEFIAAWRYYVDAFRDAGATNLLWFWCPNIWLGSGDSNTGDPSSYYPGDDYVDFTGLDGYMMKTSAALLYPTDLYMANYTTITTLSGRPFMLGEFGCSDDPRVLAATGGKGEWYRRLFAMVRDDMPRCVAVCQWQRTPGGGEINDYTIDSSGTDPAAAAAFIDGLAEPPMTAS